jgi:transcription initiation factor TFIIB
MSELDRLTDILHIPESVKEKAAIIYRGALARGLVKGRSIAAITAASVYASCRASETPRTLKDVASACRINLILKPQKPQKDGKPPKPPKRSAVPSKIRRKDVARCYRLLVKELNLRMPIEDPIKCIAKIAAKAKITMPSQQRAMQIVNEAKKNGNAVGKDPMGLAAAALYVACILQGEAEKTQADIARAANVTEVTVRNRCKGLKEVLQLNLNNKEATTCRPPA